MKTTTEKNVVGLSDIVAQAAPAVNGKSAFEKLISDYEKAHAAGMDVAPSLSALASAVALSVVKKCIDPQRKSATEKASVSNGGLSAALLAVRRGIVADMAYLDKLTTSHNAAFALDYDGDGNAVQTIVDHAAKAAADSLTGETLSDGLDIVNTAAAAILLQTAEHASTECGWMEKPYMTRRPKTKVVIRDGGTAWEDVETTPIQEVFREVRREIQNSRAAQTDPRNGYSYIEDLTTDPETSATETVYMRLQKWADVGGYAHSGHMDSGTAQSGLYTVGAQAAADYNSVLSALNLTARQSEIIRLRMSGYGYRAIATRLGVTQATVNVTLLRIREKCEKIGFTPSMWAEMTE